MSSNPEPIPDGGTNPIKSDPELMTLVKKLDSITKYKRFQKWKQAFLNRLEQFLYEEGMTPAQKACNDFDDLLKKFVKMANKVQACIEKGELTNERKTVKASLALSEMCNTLTTVNTETENLIPATSRNERKRGFTKFHLGAVLIRQGFHQYVTMNVIKDALANVSSNIDEVMDKQQHEMFQAYSTQLERFCDVMADLNLYEIMLKCIQFLEEPEDESEDPEPVEVTIKTHDGQSFKMVFEFNETVLNIKQAIECAGYTVPPDRQILTFRGTTLADDKQTVDDAKLEDGSTLMVEPKKIPIQVVNSVDGNKHEVLIDPGNTLGAIKDQLENICGLEAANQLLSMNGIELGDNDQTADFYGIKEGTVLNIEPRSIQVTVKLPDGKSLAIELVPGKDRSDSIKRMIENETGFVVPRQILKHKDSVLPVDSLVKDMGIIEGSELTVEFIQVPVTVNVHDGRQLQVMIDPFDTLESFKLTLENESGLSPDNQCLSMNGVEIVGNGSTTASFYGIKEGSVLDLKPQSIRLHVNMPNGASHSIEVQPTTDKLEDIKKKISEISNMSVPRQVISFQGQKVTDKDKSVLDLGLKDGSSLDVSVFRIPVKVNTMDGNTIEIMVDPTDTLGAIKKNLESESGLSAANQKVLLNGEELSDDNKTADDYGIEAGTELSLEPKKITVSINMPDGKQHTIEINPNDTTNDIKGKIKSKTGMEAPRQVLSLDGKQLVDGTVRDMGVREGSMIDVSVYKVPVTIRANGGQVYKVMVDPLDTLLAIKKSVEKESGLAAGNQNLFLNGKLLEGDDKTAADHAISEGSELDLEPKTMTVSIHMPDGKSVEMNVQPSDTVETVKKQIEEEAGMKSPRQVLRLAEKDMPNGSTLRDLGVNDGSTIQVEIFKIPIKVRNMDGGEISVSVEPNAPLSSVKKILEGVSQVPAKNQNLFFNGSVLSDDTKSAADYGIKRGSVLDLEPKTMGISVSMPDGSTRNVQIKPSDTSKQIKDAIAAETGMEVHRQVLSFADGRKVPTDDGTCAKDMGLREGSSLQMEIHKIPITIKTHDNQTLSLQIEPTDNVDTVKKFVAKETGIPTMKQCLKFGADELDNGRRQLSECGIKAGSCLTVEPHMDPIVFLDIKSGSLFGMDRDDVVEKGALSPNQNNKRDFLEAATDSAAKEKIKKSMLGSPKLGIATQVVVEKGAVEEYDLEEAEKVKSMWGVKLKKREKNKEGEELIFVDLKTGATGELSRKKYIDSGFLTPEGDSLKEAESDTQVYDKYVSGIRQIFGVQMAS